MPNFFPLISDVGCACTYAHNGIENGQNPLRLGTGKPPYNSLLFMVAYVYLNGLSNLGQAKPPNKPMATGIIFFRTVCIFIALQSPFDNLSEHMLSFHQLQHFMLRC
ncbi:MAG: hypothetical protein CM1200mP27_09340 [Chloroflexota bacterium]|nr:MAG: hypothetical protein CM1200mP27_09340 [Chloroflexota bacterium]